MAPRAVRLHREQRIVLRAVFNGAGGDHPAAPGDARSSAVRLTLRGGAGYERVRAKGKAVEARDTGTLLEALAAAVLPDRRRMRLISDARLSTLFASDGQATK
jgi:hypothetical protein